MHKYKVGQRIRRNIDCGDDMAGKYAKITGIREHDESYDVEVEGEKASSTVKNWWCSEFFHLADIQPHVRVNATSLPIDGDERKTYPLFSGLLAYFPAALARVSHHSFLGNEKHNPGLPLQHARNKSGDHLDCTLRHIVDSREVQGELRITELSAAAWRILAELQEELERQGIAPPAPAATFN